MGSRVPKASPDENRFFVIDVGNTLGFCVADGAVKSERWLGEVLGIVLIPLGENTDEFPRVVMSGGSSSISQTWINDLGWTGEQSHGQA